MNILVISAHADDAEVSMGGTIAKMTAYSHDVRLLVCIIPHEDRDGSVIREAKKTRWNFQNKAADILETSVEILDMDPYTFGLNRDLVKKIDKEIFSYDPDVIFTHWNHDSHQDHKAVSNATFAAARKNDASVLMYEQLTLGGITPNSFSSHVYVDISDSIDQKIDSVRSYKFLTDDNIDAVYSLARFRGHQIGVRYAECFGVCKVVAALDKSGFKISGIGKNK